MWLRLVRGLRKRGDGVRESGAFLLSKIGESRISKIVFYDELDPGVSDSGIIRFDGSGKVKLWNLLKEWKMEVEADIHTHPPGCSTEQSHSDRTHPMVKLKGHIAIIAPDFAQNSWLMPRMCSAYQYLGSFNWKKYKNGSPIKFTIL